MDAVDNLVAEKILKDGNIHIILQQGTNNQEPDQDFITLYVKSEII